MTPEQYGQRIAALESEIEKLRLAGERKEELEDQIEYAYNAMGNHLHEAFGWEKKQDGEYTYDFTIRKFIEVINEGYEKIRDEKAKTDLQVEELQKKVSEQRKMLWWCARDAGLCLHIPKAELESIPEGAELLVWYEKLFDSMALKGICSPTGQGEPVVEKTTPGKRKDEPCYCCGPRYDHKAGQCQEAMRVKRLNDERA